MVRALRPGRAPRNPRLYGAVFRVMVLVATLLIIQSPLVVQTSDGAFVPRQDSAHRLDFTSSGAGPHALDDSVQNIDPTSPIPLGNKRTAVILVKFQNDASTPYSVDHVRDATFTGTLSVNSYFKETSYGKVQLTGALRPDGDIFGWYTLPFNATDCYPASVAQWLGAARSAAANDGFVRSNYAYVIYAWPRVSACVADGWHDAQLHEAYINDPGYSVQDVAHEIGHVMGAQHASAYHCQGSGAVAVAYSGNCTAVEYGNPFDVMGSALYQENCYHKAHHIQDNVYADGSGADTSWFGAGNVVTVQNSGTYDIAPLEVPAAGPQCLQIPLYVDSAHRTVSYYVEYRRPLGLFDRFSPDSSVVHGVLINLAPGEEPVPKTFLIDTHPQTPGFDDAALGLNETYSDPIHGITITVIGLDDAHAEVRVTSGPVTMPVPMSTPPRSIATAPPLTARSSATPTPSRTNTVTPIPVQVRVAANTATPTPTRTPTVTSTATPPPTATAAAKSTPTQTPTPEPLLCTARLQIAHRTIRAGHKQVVMVTTQPSAFVRVIIRMHRKAMRAFTKMAGANGQARFTYRESTNVAKATKVSVVVRVTCLNTVTVISKTTYRIR